MELLFFSFSFMLLQLFSLAIHTSIINIIVIPCILPSVLPLPSPLALLSSNTYFSHYSCLFILFMFLFGNTEFKAVYQHKPGMKRSTYPPKHE